MYRATSRADYLPGLDGVRAIAVLAVLLYHLDINGFFTAGFLGVDLFFVLSGFLITSQLLREFQRSGTIGLRDFYIRRARRLFPAVIALLLVVVLAVEVFAPDAIRRTRADVLPAVFYFSNWWQIFSEQSYFEISGRPALLQHLWSLAIEEQFYIRMRPIPVVSISAPIRMRSACSPARPWLHYGTRAHVALRRRRPTPNRAHHGDRIRRPGSTGSASRHLRYCCSPWGRQAKPARRCIAAASSCSCCCRRH